MKTTIKINMSAGPWKTIGTFFKSGSRGGRYIGGVKYDPMRARKMVISSLEAQKRPFIEAYDESGQYLTITAE
jgi:hypothetical protein